MAATTTPTTSTPYTLGNLLADVKAIVFPYGEPASQIPAHNKWVIDCLIDLQSVVDCLQYGNVTDFPQCSTFYQCGLTVFQAPQGNILKVSAVDRINPTTHLEDATQPLDWCSEIVYTRVDFCHVKRWLNMGRGACACNLPLFFGLGCVGKPPVPTDAGLPGGLPPLQLGFHYAQTSTDRKHGRSHAGVWALDSGRIYVAPWIQSTEDIIVKWDGIKRSWALTDAVVNDPLVNAAVEEYLRWQHASKFDKDEQAAADAMQGYNRNVQMLIHQCREETRERNCEGSRARATQAGLTGSGQDVTPLFYNTQQQATATCPAGQNGTPVTVTIAAGTVASSISQADANQQALTQANQQAQAGLSCSAQQTTFTNQAQSFTATCSTSESGAPSPEGPSVTVTISAGTVTSTISQDDANAQALALATQQANAQLECTYWNASQSFTATCPNGQNGAPVTITVAEHTVSSSLSQTDADNTALNIAKTQAQSQLSCTGGGGGGAFFNTAQTATKSGFCNSIRQGGDGPCQLSITVGVGPDMFSSLISQLDANNQAIQAAAQKASLYFVQYCNTGKCGSFQLNY